MSINLITYPSDVPVSIDDWQNNIKLHDAVLLQQEDPWRIDYDNDEVMQGSVFQIQGAIYQADSDTEITGTASDYVKITPAGETASAAYVANLTGVSWNNVYKGYYDGSGNLHVFDEIKAIAAGVISAEKTKIGRAYKSLLDADNTFTGAAIFTGNVSITGNLYTGTRGYINPAAGVIIKDAYAQLSPYLLETGDTIPVTGGQMVVADPYLIYIFTHARKEADGTIELHYLRMAIETLITTGWHTLSSGDLNNFDGYFGMAF